MLQDQLKMYAMHEKKNSDTSAFCIHNLDGAIAIVNEFEDLDLTIPSKDLHQSKKKLPRM